jgi:hemolysin activation/secretion protein
VYRSLDVDPHVGSWAHQSRVFRPNPAIDDGEIHAATVRLERLTHRTRRTRAGLYHWIDVEWAGQALGGDFEYTRALADVRSVLRLSPATTLSLRAVAGSALRGTLPDQKSFIVGGVDGLRAHAFSQFHGDQMALGQAEYTVDLLHLTAGEIENGLQAIAFVDAGQAWLNPDHVWDLGAQRMELDGGFGLGSSEDNLRVYVAKDLRAPGSDWVFSVRLQRPF